MLYPAWLGVGVEGRVVPGLGFGLGVANLGEVGGAEQRVRYRGDVGEISGKYRGDLTLARWAARSSGLTPVPVIHGSDAVVTMLMSRPAQG